MRTYQCCRQLVSTSHSCIRSRPEASGQLFHTFSRRLATPLPHPSAPGPPPKAPVPSSSYPEERIARKRGKAELLKLGQTLRANQGKPGAPLQKRFWKHVSVKETEDGLQIMLDSRPVRIASKQILTIPPNKPQLALAIAHEWESLETAQQALKQHYIPLTALAARAMDIAQADAQGNPAVRESIVAMALRYLTTDTLLCWAPESSLHDKIGLEATPRQGDSLRELQRKTAEPIIGFLTSYIWPGVEIVPVLDSESIVPKPQPEMTTQVIKGWLMGLRPYELAGLERGILASKSMLIAVRLVVEWSQEFAHVWDQSANDDRFGIEEAREACTVEVAWQTGMWGEVEDTHDVDKEDLRRQLGSVILLVNGDNDRHQA